VIPLAQGGKIRLLAMTGPSRLPELPEAATAAEAGRPAAVDRCTGTPPAIVQKLQAAIRRALADPAVRDKLKAVAYAPDGRSGGEFRQLIDADIKAYADVVRAANLKFD
jgi:tripartite-type tricarboxylate transporter receptor subunit TctC